MSILLNAKGLSAERGHRELFKNISFSISTGEALHVVGANGSGKTTLMRILAGLMQYGFQGRIDRNSPIFYLGHQSALKGHLTVLENLRLDLSGWSEPSYDLVLDALTQLELAGFTDTFVNNLSVGQQRKVSLARIFLTEHTLWLLDEPFTSLDKAAVSKIEGCIEDHLLRGGAIVLTSHHDIKLSSTKLKIIELGSFE